MIAANNTVHFCFSWKILDSKKQTKLPHYKEKLKKPVIKFRFVVDVVNMIFYFVVHSCFNCKIFRLMKVKHFLFHADLVPEPAGSDGSYSCCKIRETTAG